MVWWRKRDEGFEWKTYVRTTILVRRGQRRRKVEEAREAAVDGLKMAGRRGVEAGVAGTAPVGSGAWTALKWIAGLLPGRGWQALSPQMALPLFRFRLQLAAALAPVAGLLLRPVLNISITILGWVFAIGGLMRMYRVGLDDETVASFVIAAVALVSTAGVRLLTGEASRLFGYVGARANIEGLSSLAKNRHGTLTLAGALFLGTTALWLGWGQSLPTGASLTSRSVTANDSITGRAIVLSGDTLRVGETTVRLAGIEAPELGQTCRLANVKTWSCGSVARAALEKAVRGRRVSCATDDEGPAPRQATCTVDDQDIAARLVRNGHVFANSGWLSRYGELEAHAREAKSGLWSGESEHPAVWRRRLWEEAKRDAPGGCPIKGRITSGNRIYVLPWSPSYERAKVRETRGERWFCSEDEAEAAGWTASRVY